jgi:hypothetical protein
MLTVLLSTTASVFGLSALAADLLARFEPVAPVAYVPATPSRME